ncbi:unnamed protein product [Plutella xylostella]|uniref:(diamondback moth) hypothetical protein n=1 Tax=Plutella xylostella TaxID=51655 RepID=A0A8S4E6Y0_PLUXY|nr:unnamed protein product [Plutella xylostella]
MPKERSLLTGSSGMMEGGGVRASHSSESVLDAPDSPPPKPARPNSIVLMPKERSLLTGSSGMMEGGGVRASHSSESVLDAPDSPPPKPARPNR